MSNVLLACATRLGLAAAAASRPSCFSPVAKIVSVVIFAALICGSQLGSAHAQQGPKLVGTLGVGYNYQGNSAALSAGGNTAIVGGPYDNSEIGAAWVYTRTSATNSSDTGLTASTTYTHTVSAYNAARNISRSSASNATTLAPSSGTPTLIQHVASSANSIAYVTAASNRYTIPIPNPVGAGNCIVMGVTYPHGTTISISDNNGNSWPASPAVSADGGPGTNISAIFVLPNANAGQITLTVTFGTSIQPFQYTISEFNNVATTSPVNGTSSAASQAGASLATGSFTPGNNDANGGNVIWNYYAIVDGSASGNPTSWVSDGSFTLLDGDVSGTGDQGFPHASQWYLQTTSAAINPTITATADTADSYNGVAVALKAASAGTPKPSGIHIDKIIHITPYSAATIPMQLPVTGNLRVLTTPNTGGSGGGMDITSISDNEGGSWTNVISGEGNSQIWYSPNKSANPNLILTLNVSGGEGSTNSSFRFFDVSGASPSPFDVAATYPDTDASNATTVTDAPSITPTTSNGLVIAILGLGIGPALAVTSPSGAVWDICTYAGQVDGDMMENADGTAHIYNLTTATLNWNWAITSIDSNSVFGAAAAFKALESVTPLHDFNADGKSDILWGDTNGDVAIWFMNGSQATWAGVGQVPTSWTIVGQHDFDGDGKSDILWRDTSGNVAIWFMNGSQATWAGVGQVPTNWTIVRTGDFDGDGKGDILWRDTSGNVAIWLMNGAQVTQAAAVGSAPTSWSIVETGDFDGDGKSDILLQDTSGNVAIWFMNSAQVTQSAGVGSVPAVWSIQGANAD
jgi:hypothetical protein